MTRRIPPPAGAGWTAEHLVSTSDRARDGAAIPCEKLIDPLLKERRVGRVPSRAHASRAHAFRTNVAQVGSHVNAKVAWMRAKGAHHDAHVDRKSTRLNSSHSRTSK
jgi:hypothetical protein